MVTQFIVQQKKILLIFSAMTIGVVFPTLHRFSELVQPLLMVMLFFSFATVRIQNNRFPPQLVWILIANILIGVSSYLIVNIFDHNLALAAFITAIAPTAISSAVIIGFIDRDVAFATSSILITNFGIALFVPLVLPTLLRNHENISTLSLLTPIASTLIFPFVLSRLSQLLPHNLNNGIRKLSFISYYAWLATLVIVVAKAVDFIEHQPNIQIFSVIQIAGISLILCMLNFFVGYKIGGEKYAQEASQALGQKNNSFVVWIALSFIDPMTALGPTFYILYHNLYNSWQIFQYEKQKKAK